MLTKQAYKMIHNLHSVVTYKYMMNAKTQQFIKFKF